MVAYPQPTGHGTSFANLLPSSVRTATFTAPSGNGLIVTFNPIDPGDPGVASLYNASDVAVLEMAQGGSYGFSSPGGAGFYFSATKGARNVSIIEPTLFY